MYTGQAVWVPNDIYAEPAGFPKKVQLIMCGEHKIEIYI